MTEASKRPLSASRQANGISIDRKPRIVSVANAFHPTPSFSRAGSARKLGSAGTRRDSVFSSRSTSARVNAQRLAGSEYLRDLGGYTSTEVRERPWTAGSVKRGHARNSYGASDAFSHFPYFAVDPPGKSVRGQRVASAPAGLRLKASRSGWDTWDENEDEDDEEGSDDAVSHMDEEFEVRNTMATPRPLSVSSRPQSALSGHARRHLLRPPSGKSKSGRVSPLHESLNPELRRGFDVMEPVPNPVWAEEEGVYPLIDRGQMPVNADYTPHLLASPERLMRSSRSPLHLHEEKFAWHSALEGVTSRPGPLLKVEQPVTKNKSATPSHYDESITERRALSGAASEYSEQSSDWAEYTEDQFRVVISKGGVMSETSTFKRFMELSPAPAASIAFILEKLERLCREYAVHWVEIGCARVYSLVLRPFLVPVTRDDLLNCLINREEVLEHINQPGQRYKGIGGRLAAITKIQSTWKMVVRSHLDYVRHMRAAETFWFYWKRKLKLQALARSAQVSFTLFGTWSGRKPDGAKAEAMMLGENASLLRKVQVVINQTEVGVGDQVPRSEKVETIPKKNELDDRFAGQSGRRAVMANASTGKALYPLRLMDLHDPDLDLIYVRFPLDDEIEDYVKATIKKQLKRLHMIVPEVAQHFDKNASLASMLLASPVAIATLRKLVGKKPAYIVPGLLGDADVQLSATLGIPLMSSLEEIQLFFSKSKQRILLESSPVLIPPGNHSFRNENDICEKLSDLVKSHPHISQWIFKINGAREGDGIAFIDTSDLVSSNSQTAHKDNVVLTEASLSHIRFARADLYKSWKHFANCLIRFGGVIEASPNISSPASEAQSTPNTSRHCSVNIFLEPNGRVNTLGAGDEICIPRYCFWGGLFPQQTCNFKALRSAAEAVGNQLYTNNIFGNVTVEFIVWNDERHRTVLWCIGFKPYHTEFLAQYQAIELAAGGRTDADSGTIAFDRNVARRLNLRFVNRVNWIDMDPIREASHTKDQINSDNEPRAGIYSSKLYHTNIMCMARRAFHAVCVDGGMVYDCKGTMFPKLEAAGGSNFSIMCVAKTITESIELFLEDVALVCRRLDSQQLPGQNNFMEIVECLSDELIRLRACSSIPLGVKVEQQHLVSKAIKWLNNDEESDLKTSMEISLVFAGEPPAMNTSPPTKLETGQPAAPATPFELSRLTELERRLRDVMHLPTVDRLTVDEFDPRLRSQYYASLLRKPGDPDPNVIALLAEDIPSIGLPPEFYDTWNNVEEARVMLPERVGDPMRIPTGFTTEKYLEVLEKLMKRRDWVRRKEEERQLREIKDSLPKQPLKPNARKTMKDFMAAREGLSGRSRGRRQSQSSEPEVVIFPEPRRPSLSGGVRRLSAVELMENWEAFVHGGGTKGAESIPSSRRPSQGGAALHRLEEEAGGSSAAKYGSRLSAVGAERRDSNARSRREPSTGLLFMTTMAEMLGSPSGEF
ncbi:hypothetical protein HK104_002016 [Borealophlyctis nickersoniae]|nr:hypothetical protein HK104_002016 [Borealophlyctis nickersoniae]